jgi:hypothetical protein
MLIDFIPDLSCNTLKTAEEILKILKTVLRNDDADFCCFSRIVSGRAVLRVIGMNRCFSVQQ